ncbi:MAG: hypothetical protein IPO07_16390 [Haliscomenobacter sp.]|nr:hypothetical protein [Haliscomenobacter sp.]MBK9490168.1 hypothetical protein [Haliscomenobacter sp.]
MKMAAKLFGLLFILCIAVGPLAAQQLDIIQTESGPVDGLPNPIDDVVESSITAKNECFLMINPVKQTSSGRSVFGGSLT